MLLNDGYFRFPSQNVTFITHFDGWKIKTFLFLLNGKSRLSFLLSQNKMFKSMQVKVLKIQEPLKANSNNHKSKWYAVSLQTLSHFTWLSLINNSYLVHQLFVEVSAVHDALWHLNGVSHNEPHRHETERLTFPLLTWAMRKII